MAVIQLCASQAENHAAYLFRTTGVKVFSLEEALFYAYHNWKQTADDLFSPDFIDWVRRDLKLSEIADKLRGYASLSFGDRLVSCLRVIDYFDESEIDSLLRDLDAWEKRLEWEKLKDWGDYLAARGMPGKAVIVYKKALADSRRVSLLNNLAVVLMRLERFAESVFLLEEALKREPSNKELAINYAEALIYAGRIRDATAVLDSLPPSDAVFGLFGELYSRSGDFAKALTNLTAAAGGGSVEYIYRLADYYISVSEYYNALNAINGVKRPDARTAVKRAEVFKAKEDYASASDILEKALSAWPDDAELWIQLSECCRRNYNIDRAIHASARALALHPDSARAKLEEVKVKRAQNRPREYQEALSRLIDSLKNEYRDMEEAL
ncbi:MAG: tetratricopeptide repeat protein [Clostridiales bacterium]|jgi:tetratricopeptide (TPR) repeat protein|nr:tetratricopeptide repeat protein [Clostridiales bacterium]